MIDLNYETVSRFAQQGGVIYFGALFLGGLLYALRPRNRDAFRHLSHLPLERDEDDHV